VDPRSSHSSKHTEAERFGCFVPVASIAKSVDALESAHPARRVHGVASTEAIDLQGEQTIQKGIDFDYFRKHGWITDGHNIQSRDQHGRLVSYIEAPKIASPVASECTVSKGQFEISADLLEPADDHRPDCRCAACRAQYWHEFLKTLRKSGMAGRAGFSIEGEVRRRSGRAIIKCFVSSVALTASPINTETWADLAKSLCQEPWCSGDATSPGCRCDGCRVSHDARQAMRADGLHYKDAVQFIVQRGWRQHDAERFVSTLGAR
jgi:hypothetical protein